MVQTTEQIQVWNKFTVENLTISEVYTALPERRQLFTLSDKAGRTIVLNTRELLVLKELLNRNVIDTGNAVTIQPNYLGR